MTSPARDAFLAGLDACRNALDEPLVRDATPEGDFLRKGMTVASFNLLEGFVAAQRFKLTDSQMMPGCPYGYLAIYEVETENLEQSIKALGASVGQMVITEAMDVANTAMWTFSSITKRVPA